MSGNRVMVYVQHLLGVGHQKRTAAIARAMTAIGLDVTYVSGGFPVGDLDTGGAAMVQLPPCKAADSTFSVLVDDAGRPIDNAWKERRRNCLLAVFEGVRPDVLLTEMFPFGRRMFRFELVPLLERAAERRPLVVSSIRDILVSKAKPGRDDEIVAMVERWYDLVLVHGDPDLIPIESTFAPAARIADRLRYTGYVAETAIGQGNGNGEVVVSAGGGRVGGKLLQTAIAARPLCSLADAVWRLLVGHGFPDDDFAALGFAAGDGVIVERARPDFPSLLAECAVSVSQAGYNTVMDVLTAGAPAVFVPFAEGEENEQTLRATLLAGRGLARVVEEGTLTPQSLAAAIDAAAARRTGKGIEILMDGAATAARIIADLLKGRSRD